MKSHKTFGILCPTSTAIDFCGQLEFRSMIIVSRLQKAIALVTIRARIYTNFLGSFNMVYLTDLIDVDPSVPFDEPNTCVVE